MTTLLIFIGFAVGTFGTLIGAGGGFILMPILLLLYPGEKPESLTAISLTIVFLNALSGSIAYGFKGRIHYRSAIIFSLASAPGAILGAYATNFFPRDKFELTFGVLMSAMAIYLLVMSLREHDKSSNITKRISGQSSFPIFAMRDKEGHEYQLSYNSWIGILISVVVGFLSSLLGIGGGIIHVPALVYLLDFPVHIATATSHAILAVMSALGTAEHLYSGALDGTWERIFLLAPGVIIGAQLGAYLSKRVNDKWIIRSLAIGLLSVGIRFVFF